MGEREAVFDAIEMRVIEVICPKCGGGVVFDAANETQKAPASCPSCNVGTDQEMFSWLSGYRAWYQAISKSQKKFKFRVRLKNE